MVCSFWVHCLCCKKWRSFDHEYLRELMIKIWAFAIFTNRYSWNVNFDILRKLHKILLSWSQLTHVHAFFLSPFFNSIIIFIMMMFLYMRRIIFLIECVGSTLHSNVCSFIPFVHLPDFTLHRTFKFYLQHAISQHIYTYNVCVYIFRMYMRMKWEVNL